MTNGSCCYLGAFFKKLGFTPCKFEQPLQGMELQEKETKRLRHTRNLFRKKQNLQLYLGVLMSLFILSQ